MSVEGVRKLFNGLLAERIGIFQNAEYICEKEDYMLPYARSFFALLGFKQGEKLIIRAL